MKRDHYTSIKEYIERWDELRKELKEIINYKEL